MGRKCSDGTLPYDHVIFDIDSCILGTVVMVADARRPPPYPNFYGRTSVPADPYAAMDLVPSRERTGRIPSHPESLLREIDRTMANAQKEKKLATRKSQRNARKAMRRHRK